MLQTPFVHPAVKQVHDRRQLIKVEAVSQSYLWPLSVNTRDSLGKRTVTRGRQLTKVVLWASALGTVDRLLFPLLDLGMNTQFQGFLSQMVETTHRISRTALLPCYHSVTCDVGTPGNILGPGSGLLRMWVRHVSLLPPALLYYPSYLSAKRHSLATRTLDAGRQQRAQSQSSSYAVFCLPYVITEPLN